MRRCEECSATQERACFAWDGVEKNRCGVCDALVRGIYDRKIHRVRDLPCGDARIYLEFELRRVWCRRCGAVKQERLPWLAHSPFYTKRFASLVGRRCRTATISDVARESHLDWRAIKELDKQYMREQLRRIDTPGPKAIGIDEISIRKGPSSVRTVLPLLPLRWLVAASGLSAPAA
jgi:transposase